MLKFSVTIGVNPGYDSVRSRENKDVAVQLVAEAWHKAMEIERHDNGIMVSGQLALVSLVYSMEFGCPYDGEVAVEITGRMNPEFDRDGRKWAGAVRRIVKEVKTAMKQERVSLLIESPTTSTFIYMKQNGDAVFENGELVVDFRDPTFHLFEMGSGKYINAAPHLRSAQYTSNRFAAQAFNVGSMSLKEAIDYVGEGRYADTIVAHDNNGKQIEV